jgi:hypothetical protein
MRLFAPTHTLYFETCAPTNANGTCTERRNVGRRFTYKVLESQSKVTYWIDVDREPRSFKNCSIIDDDNWTRDPRNSEYVSPDPEVRLVDGMLRFDNNDPVGDASGVRQIPAWQWWMIKLTPWDIPDRPVKKGDSQTLSFLGAFIGPPAPYIVLTIMVAVLISSWAEWIRKKVQQFKSYRGQ